MSQRIAEQPIFLTTVRSPEEKAAARLLIDSLRSFGGGMSRSPFWIFEVDPAGVSCADMASVGISVRPLDAPPVLRQYLFGSKVYACARAEELAAGKTRSLVWMDPQCMIVNLPSLYALDAECDAAVRPVHVQNVGRMAAEPPDAFWKEIYTRVGVSDVEMTVDSFVDGRTLRAYFNSHAFSINPAKGVMRRWLRLFDEMVNDQNFQTAACRDKRHQIFLFQALLSAILVSALGPDRIRILPPEYNYPYNLHGSVPDGRRAKALNDLISFVYEGRSLDPAAMDDIEMRESLRVWLEERTGRAQGMTYYNGK